MQSTIAPPTVLQLHHDHAWLAWTPPRGTYHASYRLLPRTNGSSAPEPLLHASADGTVARVGGLQAGAWYSFSVEALPWRSQDAALTSPPTRWVRAAIGADVLLLVGRMPLVGADAQLERHLHEMGLRVHAIADDDALARLSILSDANQLRFWSGGQSSPPPRLLVIAPSAPGRSIRSWRSASSSPEAPLRLPLPAVVLGPNSWTDLGLCARSELTYSRSSRLRTDGPRGWHVCVTAVESEESLPVALAETIPAALSSARVAGDALVGIGPRAPLASTASSSGASSSHRLVALGVGDDSLPYLSADGLRVLAQACAWATAAAPSHCGAVPRLQSTCTRLRYSSTSRR